MFAAITWICAGVCLFGGAHHLRVALRVGRANEHLVLAAAGFAFGSFCLFSGWTFHPIPASTSDLQTRGIVALGALGILLQGWFVQRRLGEARTAMLWVTGAVAVGILVNLLLPGGLIFEPFEEVAVRRLSTGDVRYLPDADPSRAGGIFILLVLLAPAMVLLRPIGRSAERGEAVALLAVLLTPVVLLALLVAFLPPGGPSFPWGPVAVAGTSLVMSSLASFDLGNRERVEEAAAHTSELTRGLIETAPEAIGVFDVEEARFVYVNHRAEELLQRPRSELLSADPTSFYAGAGPDAAARVARGQEILQRALAGETVTTELPAVLPDGSERPCELRVAAAHLGARTLIRTSLLDISDRAARRHADARIERELRVAEEIENLGRLAGGLAHDFNNLLTPVLGFAEAALADADDHPGRLHLEEMVEATLESAELARRLLILGRSEVPGEEDVPFAPTVHRALEVLRATLPPTQRLDHLDRGVGGSVRGNELLLQRVIIDVGVHAAGTVPPDGRLVVETRESPDRMELVIASPGGSLPESIRDRLFEPFPEPDRASPAFDGLGLSVARGVVTAWGGTLEVAMDVESGLEYRIRLPRPNL
jgi:PAS domain S-box-containing protein